MCLAMGLRRDAMYLVEAGLVNRPQRQVLAFLERMGYDREKVLHDYQTYKAELQSRVLSGIEHVRLEDTVLARE